MTNLAWRVRGFSPASRPCVYEEFLGTKADISNTAPHDRTGRQKRAQLLLGSALYYRLILRAKPADAKLHLIPNLQVNRFGLHPHPNPRRGPG